MGTTTVFLLDFLPNPRMYKRFELAKSFSEKLHLICWDRGGDDLKRPDDKVIENDVIALPAGNDPVRRLLPYRKFCKAAMKLLKEQKPNLIHVQGLDMLMLACKYKKKVDSRVHIIYEIADLHRLMVDKQKGLVRKAAQKYLLKNDVKCCKEIDLLIVTSEMYYETYFKSFVAKEKCVYMPNIPDLSAFRDYKDNKTDDAFVLGYLGGIRYKNEIKTAIEACEDGSFKFLLAGFEAGGNEIETLCRDKENVIWIGRYDFAAEAAGLYGRCDAVYSVYNADMSNVRVALPNKLYESVYCGKPIIVAKNTYLSQIVEEWGIGIAVTHNSVGELKAAIDALRDPATYEKYAQGCRAHKSDIDPAAHNKKLYDRIVSILKDQN